MANAITKGENEYFLGSIVVVDKEERQEVVDGQQRLATISILLSAVRDYFYVNGEKERADNIERQFLITQRRRTLELIPRFKLNDADHDFYLKRILTRKDDQSDLREPLRESHKRLLHAAKLASDRVKVIAQQTPREPIERLLDWVDYIEKSLRVIWFQVPDDVNAFVIFETLNDRGLGLSAADLLKNYLFGVSKDRIQEVQRSWITMNGVLEAVSDQEIIVTYIRHYWSSLYGLTREKELYSRIKEKITSKQSAIDLALNLEENAFLYAAILNPQDEAWQKYGSTARQHLEILHTLRMTQNRPLLLAILKHFDTNSVRTSLRLLVSWSVRFLICGGVGSGGMEQRYSESARRVRSAEIKDSQSLIGFMSDIVPGDAQFESSFSNARASQAYLARYYLRALEKEARGEEDPELVPNSNEEQINLEHVLPQTPSEAWNATFDEETARAYCHRIGNLALIKSKLNSEAGNDYILDKSPYYRASEYILTKEIGQASVWNKDVIDERQKKMAEFAVKAWPIVVG